MGRRSGSAGGRAGGRVGWVGGWLKLIPQKRELLPWQDTGCLVGLLVGWLAGWPVGWLVGWLVVPGANGVSLIGRRPNPKEQIQIDPCGFFARYVETRPKTQNNKKHQAPTEPSGLLGDCLGLVCNSTPCGFCFASHPRLTIDVCAPRRKKKKKKTE